MKPKVSIDDNAICVIQAAVPSGGTASFTLTSESGDADLAIQRVSDSEIVCESNNSSGVDTCYISEAGDYEVLMIAERASTSFVTYSINAEELPTGAHFEVNVAVDIDYALFEQFGTLENLQSYLAALFAYNNVMFEREVRTKLLIVMSANNGER